MLQTITIWIITSLLLAYPLNTFAKATYLAPNQFVKQSFSNQPPKAETFWFTDELRPAINRIMEHRYPIMRTKYWHHGTRTVWILEEIGKTKPITAGFVIDDNTLQSMRVLIYRESHGWEVKHDFFTNQFTGLTLQDNHKLNQHIDGISGATLSVDALTRLSRLALFLHQQVMKESTP